MRLQKQTSRKKDDKEYFKWVVTLPPKTVKALDWKAGLDLGYEITPRGLILRKKKKRKR